MTDKAQRKDEAEPTAADGIGVQDARIILGELVLRAGYGNERIVLTRRGKRAAALIGMKDLERLRALDQQAA